MMTIGDKVIIYTLAFMGFFLLLTLFWGLGYQNYLDNKIALKMVEMGHDPASVICALR